MRNPLAVTLAVLTFALAVAAHPQASTSNKPMCTGYICCWNNPTDPGCHFNPYRVSAQVLYRAALTQSVLAR